MRSGRVPKISLLLLLIPGFVSCATETLRDSAERLKIGEQDPVTFDYTGLVFDQHPDSRSVRLNLSNWVEETKLHAKETIEGISGYHDGPVNTCAYLFYEPVAGRALIIGAGLAMASKSASKDEARGVQRKAVRTVNEFARHLHVAATTVEPKVEQPFHAELSKLVRVDITRDQVVFDLPDLPTPEARTFLFQTVWGKVCETDVMTSEALKRIESKAGWPDGNVYGEKLDSGAGRILVHSPDIEFQRSMIPKLQKLYAEGRTSGGNLARLTDTVAYWSGKKLVYGTKFRCGPDGIIFAPVEDPDNLGIRRASLGLDSVEKMADICK